MLRIAISTALLLSSVEEVQIMRDRYSSDSYELFLEDLREEIRFKNDWTQEAIARFLGINRSTLCRKLNRNGQELTGEELFKILMIL